MQNTLHELSHGDKSSKKRFETVISSLFILSSFFFFLQKQHIAIFLWIVTASIGLMYNYSPKNEFERKNERKNETKTQYKVAYGVDRTRVLVMLRNIEAKKRQNV